MNKPTVAERIAFLVSQDPRFPADAYQHVLDSFGLAQRQLDRRDVDSGSLLSAVLTELALRYGPCAELVAARFGIASSLDFAEICVRSVIGELLGWAPGETAETFAAGLKDRDFFAELEKCVANLFVLDPPRILAKAGK